MATRTNIKTVGLVDPAYENCRIKLTRHMAATWSRFDLRDRFHLKSDRNRLGYISWYVIHHLLERKIKSIYIDPVIVSELNAPISAFGPMTVFLHEVWRDNFRDDKDFNIHTESGYFNFASVVIYDYASRGGLMDQLIPDGYYTFCHKPGLWDGVHFVSRVALALHARDDTYRAQYDLKRWEDRESFNFNLLIHAFVQDGNRFAIAPETMRYWSEAAAKADKRISRFALALAMLSNRFDIVNLVDFYAHVEEIVTWIRSEIFAAFPPTKALIPAIDFQDSPLLQTEREARSILRRDHGISVIPGDSKEEIDVLLIGPFSVASGLGTGTRRSVEALSSLNINFKIVDFRFDNPAAATEKIPEKLIYRGENPKLTLWHFNAEFLADAMIAAPLLINPNLNIGYFFWETEAMPLNHQLGVDMVDEVWAPSEFVKSCYANHGAPVTNVSTSVKLPTVSRLYSRSHFGLKDESYTFMFSFDGYSTIHRKNPVAVVKAFLFAFPDKTENVELIIKSQNFSTNHWIEINGSGEEFIELLDSDSRIHLLNRTMSLDELYWLKGNIDSYVSLHRSEGFGYGPAEAMALGRPVIMTNYSANVEFATEGGCLLVDAHLVPVLRGEYLYWRPEMQWAEANIEQAATFMRDLASGRLNGRTIGQIGAAHINEHFGREAMAARYKARLKELNVISSS